MANRKEYEMLFRLGAQMNGEFARTFRMAQSEISTMQKEIQALGRTQADISAYQKQQAAVDGTKKKLEVLQQQYDNIQKEISETGTYSSDLENKLLSKQLQIDKTSASLEKQTARLNELGESLHEAGVDTDDLTSSSERLSGEIDTLKQKQEEAADKAVTFGSKAEQALNKVHEAIVAAGVAAALKEIYDYFASCGQASMDFESAITGVAKTTDLTDEELSAMSDSIKALSTEIPATTEEIAAVTEAAGQLGIQKDALLDFTEIMTMLGTATNMTADEAATALARFANITGMETDNYGRLGSVIVDLGNNFATTESEIVAMGTHLASAGKLAGLTEPEIMALAAAMSSVGIEAEAGGTAMTQTLNAIEKAVAKGGDDLAEFARIAGMSSEEFSSAWKNDAMSALTSFIGGLGKLDEQGESTVLVLEDLGLTGIRQSNMLKALGLAADQMTGAVNTANTAWQQNTALTNEANKRYATAQSRLTMMQNAYNNLKVAIGDAYTPALSKAYSIGAKMLNGITAFIQANPALVNAVTAFVGVIGAVIAALAAYAVAAKVAAAASALLSAAIPGVNVIMGVTAAVAAITAGIVALATASANNAVPSVRELTEAARGMREAMDDTKATYEETVASTLAAANVADTYISKLEEMGDYASLSADEQQQYHNTLALICQVVPDLADSIDLETDSITGGTEALRANTEAWRQNAMQQAYQNQLTELYSQYSAVLIESEENSIGLTKAQYSLAAAQQKLSDTYSRMDELWADAQQQANEYYDKYGLYADATAFLSQEYYDLQNSIDDTNSEIQAADSAIKNYSKAIEEDSDSVAKAKEEISLAEEAVQNLTSAMNDGVNTSEEAAAQSSEFEAAISNVREKINALAESYNEAYGAAYESITGQYQLWDEAAVVVATSAGSINSALESQITYWQDYNANLQSLTERSADIEGLSDMIASFADGSTDSVNAIAGMAGATDEQLAAMVASWRVLQQEQQNAAGSVADLKTDFTAAMDELQTALADDIEAMDMCDEAKENAQATVQGFIDGAVGMLPQVQTAYQLLADTATAALSSASYGGAAPREVSGNATGTTSAEDIFIAGENGPELIVGHRGASVFPAQETQRIIEALPRPGGSDGNVVEVRFAPVYYLDGVSNPADLEEILRSHDDDMRDYILQVLAEAGIDADRRAYV